MRFPSYELYESAPCQPLDGYLAYTGKRNEQDPYPQYMVNTKRHAVALFVQGCTQLAVEQNPRQAKKTFLDARRVLIAVEGNEEAGNERTLGLDAVIHAVAFRNQRKTIATVRESLHTEVMGALQEAWGQFNERKARAHFRGNKLGWYKGKVNQLTTLGMFTRLGAHPWIGAWPALDYHDAPHDNRATISQNADIILGETTPSMTSPEVYSLQVKSACLGLCDKARPVHFEDPRTRYGSNVILVSAECDLGYNPVNRSHEFPATQLLCEEFEDTIPPDGLAQLDSMGNNLLLAITGASGDRRGTLPPTG